MLYSRTTQLTELADDAECHHHGSADRHRADACGAGLYIEVIGMIV